MAGEIASAYVRIRPQLAGFRDQTIAGVKGALTGVNEQAAASTGEQVSGANRVVAANERVAQSYQGIARSERGASEAASTMRMGMMGIAKVVGITFGIDAVTKFTASLIEGAKGAGQLQKSIETIHATFGSAAEALIKFGDKGATALGISAASADATSAKFGILFKNMGIAPGLASTMTVNLEKLAGSLSSIRGVDPSRALQQITLAMLGNVRSLKQLGVAVDPAAIKIAALRLGLIQQGQALTPAVRAQAIYAIATSHLGEYMQQAKAHAGDLTNVQRRLSAEWSNAKDKLGGSLLPAMTKIVQFLSRILPGAVKITTLVFGDLSKVVQGVAKFIAPAFEPIVKEIEKLHSMFKSGLGIEGLKKMFDGLSPAAKGAAVAVGALGALMAIAFASAFPITATIAGLVALGVGFEEAYKHSARFRDIVDQVKTVIVDRVVPAFKELVTKSMPLFAALWKTVSTVFTDILVIIERVVKAGEWVWNHFGAAITKIATRDFNAIIRMAGDWLKILAGIFNTIKDVLTGKWGKAWDDIKGIVRNAFDLIKTDIVTAGKDLGDIFSSIWDNLEKVALIGVSKVLAVIAKIPTSFKIFGHTFGFENPAKTALDAINAKIKSIDSQQAASELAKATATNITKGLNAKLRDPAIAIAAATVGTHVSKTVKDAAVGAVNTSVPGITTAAIDAGVRDAQTSLSQLKQKLHDMITQNAIDIANSVREAKSNLLSIAGSLADQIGQVIDQPFVVASQRLQFAQDRLSAVFDRKNAVLQAQATKLSALQGRLGLLNDQRSLMQMRNEVALPGGQALSTDPKAAIRQLNQLARGANDLNRPAIEAFITQYRGALLQVQSDKLGLKQGALSAKQQVAETRLQLKRDTLAVAQDTATQLKIIAQRSMADFAAALTSHKITLRQFNRDLAELLGKDHVSYRNAGKLLGSAFAAGFKANVEGIVQQAAALAAGPQQPGTGQEPKITRPASLVEKDALKVARLQHQIAHQQLTIQKRIAKATEKTAIAVQANQQVILGPTSKAVDHNPGSASKKARHLSSTGG